MWSSHDKKSSKKIRKVSNKSIGIGTFVQVLYL